MPQIDDECPNCGHGRYWVDRDRKGEIARCTECDHVVPDSAIHGRGEA